MLLKDESYITVLGGVTVLGRHGAGTGLAGRRFWQRRSAFAPSAPKKHLDCPREVWCIVLRCATSRITITLAVWCIRYPACCAALQTAARPCGLPATAVVGRVTEDQLYTILEAGSGVNDMSNTHIPLQRLHIAAAADANFSQGGIGSSSDGSTAVLAAAAALQVYDLHAVTAGACGCRH